MAFMASLVKKMLLLLVLFSVCESMLSFYKVSGKTALAEESLAMRTLMLLFFYFLMQLITRYFVFGFQGLGWSSQGRL